MVFQSGLQPRVLLLVSLLVGGVAANAQAPAAGSGWKLFQEFGPFSGSWSGTAEQGGRIGGRSVSWSQEAGGGALVFRATTFFPEVAGKPEEKTQEVATFVYDGDKGKYVALVVFSTKVWGLYDVDFRPDGSVGLVSRELVNLEAGTKARIVLSKKPDGELSELIEVAPGGKEFVGYLTSKLSKK
jgi:hypothetical protein